MRADAARPAPHEVPPVLTWQREKAADVPPANGARAPEHRAERAGRAVQLEHVGRPATAAVIEAGIETLELFHRKAPIVHQGRGLGQAGDARRPRGECLRPEMVAAEIAQDERGRHGAPDRELHVHWRGQRRDRKSTRLNSSHPSISYAVFWLKKKRIKVR